MKLLHLILIPFYIAFALLAGCAGNSTDTITSAGQLAAETKAADILIQSGQVESAVLDAPLTEEHLASVVSAFEVYENSRAVVGDLFKQPAQLLTSVVLIQAQHDNLVAAYHDIQQVVKANWQYYTPQQQASLERWQQQARQLEARYQVFTAALQNQLSGDAERQAAMELLTTVAQIALMSV